ncbi:protein ACCELERATED CELL DEATH 6-like [Juglans regia]|uniref:Protein ACCELERATED CELL DEATH 6-like n=1 Tax=Juglans regia TaxID=51240 RepID=A0A6P9ECI8_JUGRE|nr:protein ACCELERATED CELL DEATH 6-like [Juglans regia]
MEVDPEFSFGANVDGETPLYLAAERQFPDLVSEILNKLKSPAYDGPLGRTALHAAACYDDEGGRRRLWVRGGVWGRKVRKTEKVTTKGDEIVDLEHKGEYEVENQSLLTCFHVIGRVLEVGHDEIEKHSKEVVSEKVRKTKTEEDNKAAQAHLVVAALITTVTFAAGNAMPGGFVGGDDHPHLGFAVLRNSAALKAFIITNALSIMLSSSAIFIHLFIPLMPFEYFFVNRVHFLQIAFSFLLFAMAPMVLAFVTVFFE